MAQSELQAPPPGPQAPQQSASQEEPGSPTNSKLKSMRRIPQKSEAPTDKAELIQYLSDRITQAEDALGDTEQLLESEVKQRQNISTQIEQRNLQLQKLYEVDQRGLPEKIKERLTQILTTTISQKVEAQQRLNEEKSKNYEFKRMYDELKWEEKNINHKLTEQKEKQEKLNGQIATLDEQNQKHEEELKEQEQSYKEFKEKKEQLENKYLQMKVALDRMGDIKAVLNRFFGNEDLFDQKMELKEQTIKRIEVPSRQSQNRQPPKDSRNQTRLKPLNYTSKNEDQDFWRADYKSKF